MVELLVGRKYVSYSEKPKYKAQLIAKGFKQEHGLDYDKIFSPEVKMTIFRLLLSFVATEDLQLKQLYVKSEFLHGDLDPSMNTYKRC